MIPSPFRLLLFGLGITFPLAGFADNSGPNLLPCGSFSAATQKYIPWDGVDDQGHLHGIEGAQLAVDDSGRIQNSKLGPSVAIADLNGDGKPDLVLADSAGYFWFFANCGTAKKPAFTRGELMPVWLGERRTGDDVEGYDNVVPRIQLVDLQHNGLLDIVAGTYAGKLFFVTNRGSMKIPSYSTRANLDGYEIKTHTEGQLWCNYLAPCLTSAFAPEFSVSHPLDLIMGEGTYSANSIYWLQNSGSDDRPIFDENHLNRIIPGMGMEHLTPAVLDWNNDGKPDILTGDRTGHLTLFINNSSDPAHPTFEPGKTLSVGGQDQFGGFTTVTVCDLTGNHLPNLLIGSDRGILYYAENTGTIGKPNFTSPLITMSGTPAKTYLAPTQWYKFGAYGVPYELLSCINPQTEKGFEFPDGVSATYSLKFHVVSNSNNVYFHDTYYPDNEDGLNEHGIQSTQSILIKRNARYRVHFWAKSDKSDINFRFRFFNRGGLQGEGLPWVEKQIDVNDTWTECSEEASFQWDRPLDGWNYGFEFRFVGQPTLYICDLSIQEVR